MAEHICICICTYKRPQRLSQLIQRIQLLLTEKLFNISIVVVDNDKSESARKTVEELLRKSAIPIQYYVEAQQNISRARNKAIENSHGDYVAFIDDDELPAQNWLYNLYMAIKLYKTDGILGPVMPYFELEPPRWVKKGRIFERENHLSGFVLEWQNTRTGNALLKRDIFLKDNNWFNPEFGSGGEDRDFFRRKIVEGYIFSWCNEAPVYEVIPPERWKKSILFKRALLRGRMALNAANSRPISVFYSIAALGVYAICLPLLPILGQHILIKYIVKCCDHLGKVCAFCGIELIKEKYISGE